jgi:hypothetical protein
LVQAIHRIAESLPFSETELPTLGLLGNPAAQQGRKLEVEKEKGFGRDPSMGKLVHSSDD